MRKSAMIVLAIVSLAFLLTNFGFAGTRDDDLQAIKKAVKENPNYEPGKEVKWFKVLVTDTKTNKDRVRITLPLVLVEAFVKCADNKNLRLHDEHCNINFEELLTELKKVGPMALIEVYEEDELVKVWLE
jgi:hypothetical protein